MLTDPARNQEEDSGTTWYFGTVQDSGMGKVHESDREARSYVTLLCEDGEERLFWLSNGCKLPAENIWGEYVMVRARTEHGTGLRVITSLEVTEQELQKDLAEAIQTAILAHHVGKYYPAQCQTAHFKLLFQNRDEYAEGDQITCYGIVYYHEYNLKDGVLMGASGALIPTVLTFRVSEDHALRLAQYWEPRDGIYEFGAYDYSTTAWEEVDRKTIEHALKMYPIVIPEAAHFESEGEGWYSFTCLSA